VWSALSFAILTTVFVLWSWQLDPRPKPWLWGLIVAGGFFFRPALMAILNGQHSLFLVGCAMLAWGLIVRKHDAVAGIVLAIAVIKPSVFLFMPMVILLWALRWRRWSIILGFAGMLTVSSVITFIQIGWWIPDYLALLGSFEQVRNDTIGLAWSMSSIATPFGLLWLGQGLIVLFVGLGRLWRHEDFPWLASIAAVNLNLIFTPHIIEYDMGILLIPLLWLGAEWSSRRWGMAAWLALIWFPWLSWILVFATMGTAGMWQQVMWLGYTNLLLLAVLVWLRIKNEPFWHGVI
jgi:hypothetical protein